MVKAKELRDQPIQELQALYQDLSKELFGLRNEQKITRKMEKPHLVRMKKKDRARVLTVLREKKAPATS
ncbi:MAG: 50S ribosomal protein L29 [Verrucomicrobia bacterium]|nr:50S ribosomal protein L29 [Verrucomicrobiota bacterium]